MSVLILSGPSGSGKSTLCSALMQAFPDAYFSISSTTRKPRVGERDGVDYYFLDQKEFLGGIERGEFLEWAEVHSNYYGTSLKPVQKAIDEGRLVIFDVDVQGHGSIKKHYGELAASVFITTPSRRILEQRLRGRGSDDEEIIQRRLTHAYAEMQHMGEFDFLLVNDDMQQSIQDILAIAQSLRCMQTGSRTQQLLGFWTL